MIKDIEKLEIYMCTDESEVSDLYRFGARDTIYLRLTPTKWIAVHHIIYEADYTAERLEAQFKEIHGVIHEQLPLP